MTLPLSSCREPQARLLLPPSYRSRSPRRISLGFAVRTALSATIATVLIARAHALTIIPVWDSSITNDPNAAQIESIINGVLTTYQNAFSGTNLTLKVNILEDSSIGGANNSPNTFSASYTAYRAALQSHATTLDDVAVVARLTPSNPVNTSSNVTLSRANAAALGFSVPTNVDGSVTTGTIREGLTSGGSVNANFIKQTFAHELDEELGTISGAGGSTPWSIDFTRYSAANQRSFNGNTATHAYVSVDGVNMLAEYNQFNRTSGDWGDFAGGGHVQDYFVSGTTVPAVELRMLDTVGYGYTGRSISNAFVSNTLNTVPLSTVSTSGGVIPNVPSNDVQIIEGGGSGLVTLGSATTGVNSLTNTATTTAVTVNLAGQQLVAGNGSVDAGVGLIEVGSGSTALTVGASVNDGTVTAGSSGAYTLGLISANPSSALDIKSSIVNNAGAGAVSVIVLNTGTVIMEGTNTYSGTTTIGSGSTLQIGNGGTTGNLGAGAVEVDGTLRFNRSNSITVANSLTGAGTVVQSGTGTVTLTGGNSGFTGAFTINFGTTLQVGAGATTGGIGSASITDNGSLVFNRSNTFVVANSIVGSGSLTQVGAGTLSLTTTPGHTGGTNVQSGILQIAGGANLGTGNYSVSSGARVQYSSTATQTYSGVISGGGGLTKDTDPGTLTLTAANTYTGATTVTAGTLGLNFSGTDAPTSNIISSSSALVLGGGNVLITGSSGKSLTQTFAGTTFTGTQGNLTLSQNAAAGLDVNLGSLTFNIGSAVSFNGATGSTVGARFLTTTGSANGMLAPGAMYNGTDWAAKDASNIYVVAYTGYVDIFTGTTGSKSVIVPNTSSADVRIQENGSTGAPNTLTSAPTTINSLLMNASTTASTISMSNGALTINGGTGVTGGVAVASGAKSLTIGSFANDGSITAGAAGASTLLLVSNNSSVSQGIVVNSTVKDNAGNAPVTLGVSGGTGGGTVVLNGTNTFSGNVEITNGGTLQIGGSGSLGSGSYAGTIQDFGTFRYSSTVGQTLSGAISGSGALTKDTGTGTLTLTGANTYTGNTTISAGTLQISGSGVLGGGNYAGTISGAGAFVYNSSATQTLSGSNTFTSNVTVSAGLLKLGNSNALGAVNTAVTKATIASGATLDVAGFSNTNYGLTISGTGSAGQGALINSGASTNSGNIQTPNIALAGNAMIGGTGDFYEIASGYGANTLNLAGFTLTKSGTNTFWLANTTVTAGTVDVSSGKLSQFKASNMSAAALVLENTASAALSLNNLALSVGSLSGGGTTGGNVSLGSGTLTVGALNASTTYAGVISGTGGVTLTGTGVLALTGANTYTGSTTISSGTLSFASGALDSTSGISMNGGTLLWNGTNTEDLSSSISMVSGKTATFDTNGNTVTMASDVGGSTNGSLVKKGNGALVLATDQSYTGTTTVAAGKLQLGSSTGIGTLAGGGSVTVNSGATLAFGQSGAATIANAIFGPGALDQVGTGTTTLSGTCTFSGAVAVNAGVLLLSGSLGDASVTIASGGTFGGTGTVGSSITQNASLTFQTGSMLDYAGSPLTLNGNVAFAGSTAVVFAGNPVSGTQYALVDYTGTLTGAANLTSIYRGTVDTATPGVLKFDAGAISLTWRGTTNANWGLLDANHNFVRTASPATADNFYQGDTVVFDDSSTVKSVTLNGSLSPAAVIVNSTGTYTFGGSGFISGAASVTQNGTGTVVMNMANTYTGTTTVNAGTFKLGNASALGATSGVTIASGATLDLNALTIGNLTLAGAGALGNSSTASKAYVTHLTLFGDATVSNTSSQKAILLGSTTGQNGSVTLGGFTLTKNGTGTLILNGINLTGAGNITINGGTVQIMDDYGANQQPTTIAGTGNITVNSGASLLTPRWSPTLSMTMPIVLNGGTLGSNWPGPNGATIASAIRLTASSSLNFNGGYGNVTLSGVISGGASSVLTVNGDSGTRTFTGMNTYTGNTTLSAGTLTIAGAGSLGAGLYAGAISLTSGTTFNHASTAAQTLSGAVSGAGALTQSGTGLLTLSGTNTYSGATTVSAGTLVVSGSISGSTTTVKSNAAVAGTGTLGVVSVQSGGTLHPGAVAASGLLSSGNFSLLSGGHLTLEIGGVTGTGTSSTLYSELSVTGTVSLAGDAQITLFNGYTPSIGDTFYIILNDGSDAISGTFSNDVGGFITSGGIQYKVNYQANGDGGSNDVSLTVSTASVVPEPSAVASLMGGLGLLANFRRRRKSSK